MKRGEEIYKDLLGGKLALLIRRSSDGLWKDINRWVDVRLPRIGRGKHNDKKSMHFIFGEYLILVAWFRRLT